MKKSMPKMTKAHMREEKMETKSGKMKKMPTKAKSASKKY